MKLAEALLLNPVKVWRTSWIKGFYISAITRVNLDMEELLADDWCVEEKSIQINMTDLKALVNKHIADGFELNSKFEQMAKEMGLT
jgi:hypothetical protein